MINIDISEGDLIVEVTDLHHFNANQSGSGVISFTIPGSSKFSQNKESKLKDSTQGEATTNAFVYSEKFIVFHVTVKSASSNPSLYTISYSTGEREFDLQDGLITSYMLEPKK